MLPLLRRHAADAQRAQEAVGVQRALAEGLGEAAGADAAVRLHLPQAVLGMCDAEAEVGVVDAAGADGGDAVGVALDAGLAQRAGQRELALGARQHALRVPEAGRSGQDDQPQQAQGRALDPLHRHPPLAPERTGA